jgi:hypothetical protein
MITVFFTWLVLLIMQDNMLTTHRCTLLGGFSRELHYVDYSWVYQPNHHGLTTLNLEGSSHEFCILSFRRSTMSSVHYIPGALATALGVPSFRGHNGCIPRRQSQAHSCGKSTMSLKSMAQVHKLTPVAPSSSLLQQPYLGSEIHGSGTQVHSSGTSRR